MHYVYSYGRRDVRYYTYADTPWDAGYHGSRVDQGLVMSGSGGPGCQLGSGCHDLGSISGSNGWEYKNDPF